MLKFFFREGKAPGELYAAAHSAVPASPDLICLLVMFGASYIWKEEISTVFLRFSVSPELPHCP